MPMNTFKTNTITGKFAELKFYKYAIPYGYSNSNNHNVDIPSTATQILVKNSSYRAKNNIRRLIIGNIYHYREKPVFLTLTFKENIKDLKKANKEFTNFIKRINRYLGFKMRYIAVPEFQERGAVHYHTLIFNLPFISGKKIETELWKQGATNIRLVRKGYGIFGYITKYLTKTFSDPRYKGKKRYFGSLENRPVKIMKQEKTEKLLATLKPNQKIGDYKYNMKDRLGNVCNNVEKSEYIMSS